MTDGSDKTSDRERLGGFAYVIGGISFVPLLGVPFGIAAIAWGLLTKRRGGIKLAVVGVAGIALTFALYGSLFYFGFVQRGGIYDKLRTEMAQSELNSAVPLIEYYKITHGHYPNNLADIIKSLPKDSYELTDFFDPRVINTTNKPHYFYYKMVNSSHYYLRAVAPNGDPFGPGSLGPRVKSAPGIGLLTQPTVKAASPSQ